jgi:diguanylate cyclase (GGDEF)-like protein/PAS domain S-box-containing protein
MALLPRESEDLGTGRRGPDRPDAEAALDHARRILRALVENSHGILFALDEKGVFTLAEGPGIEAFGRAPGSLIGRSVDEVFAEFPAIRSCVRRVLAGEEVTAVIPLGNAVFDAHYQPLHDQAGTVAGVVVVATDITGRRRAAEDLWDNRARLELVNAIATGITTDMPVEAIAQRTVLQLHGYFSRFRVAFAEVGPDGRLTYLQAAQPAEMPAVLGQTVSLGITAAYTEALHDRRPVIVRDAMLDPRLANHGAGPAATGARALLHVPVYYMGDHIGLLCFETADPHAWSEHEIATLTDVADYLSVAVKQAQAQQERTLVEEALRRRETRLRHFLDNASDLIQNVDADGRLLFVNRAWCDTLDYRLEDLDRISLVDILRPEDRGRVLAICRSVLADEAPARVETVFLAKDGHEIPVEGSISAGSQDDGRPAAWGIFRDVTDRRALEEQLRRQALYDPLTGLPNRRLLAEHATEALADGNRQQMAALYLDLDGFKAVNDSLGHGVGDGLLAEVAQRLTDSVRATDIVARLGGDEFVVLLRDASNSVVQRVAERILAACGEPFAVDGHTISIGASIGVARGSPRHTSAEDLVREADIALYQAKAAGKGRIAVYEPETTEAIGDIHQQ